MNNYWTARHLLVDLALILLFAFLIYGAINFNIPQFWIHDHSTLHG